MDTLTISFDARRIRKVILAAVALAAVVSGILFVPRWLESRALQSAQKLLDAGFPALAAEELEPYRKRIADNERSCATLVKTYTALGIAGKLQLAVESCLRAHVQTFDVVTGIAEVQLLRGQYDQALRTLASLKGAHRSETVLNTVLVLRRMGQRDAVARTFIEGLKEFPTDLRVASAALGELSSRKLYKQAKVAADILSHAPEFKTAPADLKLAVADVYDNTGDKATAVRLRAELSTASPPGKATPSPASTQSPARLKIKQNKS